MTTFLDFAKSESRFLWDSKHHRTRSTAKAARFAEFSDHKTRHIGDYQTADVNGFISYLLDEGLTENTANHYTAMCKKVFTLAEEELPTVTKVPKLRWLPIEKNKRPLYFTGEQLAAMEAYFTDDHPQWWLRHFIIIGHQTGMRLGEILKICPKIIGRVANGGYNCTLEKTKNGDTRCVPFNTRTMASVEALGFVTGAHWDHRPFYNAWGQMRDAVLGGNDLYKFHTLRHTTATRLANDFDRSTAVIALLLGHRCLETTKKYIHAKPEALRSLVDQLED